MIKSKERNSSDMPNQNQPPRSPKNKTKMVVNNDEESNIDKEVKFTYEEIMDLLNERPKPDKFDQVKIEEMYDTIKRLQDYVRWYKELDKNQKLDKLRLDLAYALESGYETTYTDDELGSKAVGKRLQEKLVKEKFRKLEAIQNHMIEKERRIAAEKLLDSLREMLGAAKIH